MGNRRDASNRRQGGVPGRGDRGRGSNLSTTGGGFRDVDVGVGVDVGDAASPRRCRVSGRHSTRRRASGHTRVRQVERAYRTYQGHVADWPGNLCRGQAVARTRRTYPVQPAGAKAGQADRSAAVVRPSQVRPSHPDRSRVVVRPGHAGLGQVVVRPGHTDWGQDYRGQVSEDQIGRAPVARDRIGRDQASRGQMVLRTSHDDDVYAADRRSAMVATTASLMTIMLAVGMLGVMTIGSAA